MAFRQTTVGAFATALVVVVGWSSRFALASVSVPVTSCADLDGLRPPRTDDVEVILIADTYNCNTVATIKAYGPWTYQVISPHTSVSFSNVRIEVLDGAKLFLNLDESAYFTGISAYSGSSGGVVRVLDGSAMFNAEVVFEDNSVAGSGGSGGAIYAGGEVVFTRRAEFSHNLAKSGHGGALDVGINGSVTFKGLSSFVGNSAEDDYSGGAIMNWGAIHFEQDSVFRSNAATKAGGAIFAVDGAITTFREGVTMKYNTAGDGGAIYNLGKMTVERNAYFESNLAEGYGSHVYSGGEIVIGTTVEFANGYADEWAVGARVSDGGIVPLPVTPAKVTPDVLRFW